jgi:hypothetical protein
MHQLSIISINSPSFHQNSSGQNPSLYLTSIKLTLFHFLLFFFILAPFFTFLYISLSSFFTVCTCFPSFSKRPFSLSLSLIAFDMDFDRCVGFKRRITEIRDTQETQPTPPPQSSTSLLQLF